MSFQPEKLRFTPTHEWVHAEVKDGETVVTVGISQHAIDELSDVVFVELPAVGKTIKGGEIFGHAESVKALADLYAPVGLVVTEANVALQDNLNWIKEDPYGKGWMVRGTLRNPADLEALLDHDTYKAQCGGH